MSSRALKDVLRFLLGALHHVLPTAAATRFKELGELRYWRRRKAAEGELANDHYLFFYTRHFGLDPAYYTAKKILDIGCGPRGSLEWAHMAAERVGLDPLADEYRKLGAARHKMTYVAATAERIPFPDGHFDAVSSFNSLDHVADLTSAIHSIGRVLRPGGDLLLLTDVNHPATLTEPQEFDWHVIDRFSPLFDLVSHAWYEAQGDGLYQSVRRGRRWDPADPRKRSGILSARFVRKSD